MKKIFLLNFVEEVDYIKKNFSNNYKLVALNLNVYLQAKKNNLDVVNFDDILDKSEVNLSKYENDLYRLKKNLDQNICHLKELEEHEVLVNSTKFNILIKHVLKQSIIIHSISNYFSNFSIFFFENVQRENNLFNEICNNIGLHKKIIKKEKISLKPTKTNNLFNENFFNEEKRKSFIGKYLILSLIEFFLKKFGFKKKNILYYLLEKKIIDNTKKNFNYINYELNSELIPKKNLSKKLNDITIDFDKYFSNSVLIKFKSKLVDEAINYYYDVYINNLYLSKKILNKNKIKLFITSHMTLVTSAIVKNCAEMGIKSLVLLHGGAIAHLFNLEKFPNFNLKFLNNLKSINYFQVYSEKFKNCIIKNNNLEKLSNNIIVLPYVKKKINKKNFVNKSLKIGYFCQTNFINFLDYTKTGINSEITLHNIRQKIFNKINSYNNLELNISSYRENFENICCKKTLEIFKKKNKINFYHYNAKKLLANCDVFIIEQLSSVFIESLSFNKPTILFKNENYDYGKYFDEVNLEKNLFVSKSQDEILKNIDHVLDNINNSRSYFEQSHILKNYYNLSNNFKSYEQAISKILD